MSQRQPYDIVGGWEVTGQSILTQMIFIPSTSGRRLDQHPDAATVFGCQSDIMGRHSETAKAGAHDSVGQGPDEGWG
jgi:hypothetical protein